MWASLVARFYVSERYTALKQDGSVNHEGGSVASTEGRCKEAQRKVGKVPRRVMYPAYSVYLYKTAADLGKLY
jgi:hypothetical protein